MLRGDRSVIFAALLNYLSVEHVVTSAVGGPQRRIHIEKIRFERGGNDKYLLKSKSSQAYDNIIVVRLSDIFL
jgi:hypothetical protein